MQVLTRNFTARLSLGDFDLSRNNSLQTLEVTARDPSRFWLPIPNMGLLTHALSTITSPTFSEVTVFYQEHEFYREGYWLSQAELEGKALLHHRRFEEFRKMHKVRNLRLVLCVDVWRASGWYPVHELKWAVTTEKANNGFDDIFPEPPVFYIPRRTRFISFNFIPLIWP